MAVVAMSLKMEIVVFIQEDHPSDGSSFPSTSTYLQSKSSWCPSLNSQGLRVRMSHIWSITHLFSHWVFWITWLHAHHTSAMALSGTAPFRRKATPHPGEHNSLYHDGSLITCVALHGQVLSQSLPHTNTQYRISFGEKRYHSKHPNKITWTMKSRNDWGEHPMSCHFNRKGLFRLGNI